MFNLNNFYNKYIKFKEPKPTETFILKESQTEAGQAIDSNKTTESSVPTKQDQPISRILNENLNYLRERYNLPRNSDIVIREFDINFCNLTLHALIIFFDGMVDKNIINNNLLQPMMLLSTINVTENNADIALFLKSHLLEHNQLSECKNFNTFVAGINYGCCGILVDSLDTAYLADVKGFERRTVERPNIELLVRGPQEGFTETLRVNVALIRKRMKDENLIGENFEIGTRGKTLCTLLYLKDIANDSLVTEVRRRLQNVSIDYLKDSGELEQLIEDRTLLPIPLITATERPDRAVVALAEGKVSIVVDGSPFILLAPAVFTDLIHSSEDYNLRYTAVNLLRTIRLVGTISSLLLPGIYIAITNFHQEMIPTSLLLAIDSSREKVPFPSIVEMLAMEIAFETIREAGIRIPGPLGPTIGIIGALVLGQAAVAANIVSPILIIIVAVTGIGSFSIPDYSMAFTIRILRFVYIFLGASSGFLGLSTGVYINGLLMVNAKSFGVPILSPYGPKTYKKNKNNIFTSAIWKRENRPDYLNTKDNKREPHISKGWDDSNKKGDKNEG